MSAAKSILIVASVVGKGVSPLSLTSECIRINVPSCRARYASNILERFTM